MLQEVKLTVMTNVYCSKHLTFKTDRFYPKGEICAVGTYKYRVKAYNLNRRSKFQLARKQPRPKIRKGDLQGLLLFECHGT